MYTLSKHWHCCMQTFPVMLRVHLPKQPPFVSACLPMLRLSAVIRTAGRLPGLATRATRSQIVIYRFAISFPHHFLGLWIDAEPSWFRIMLVSS